MPKHHHHNDTNSPIGSHGAKGPMRQWAAPSYDPDTGRAVSSVDEQGSRDHIWQNNHATGNAQIPDGGFKKLDHQRSQNPTPVKDRKFT